MPDHPAFRADTRVDPLVERNIKEAKPMPGFEGASSETTTVAHDSGNQLTVKGWWCFSVRTRKVLKTKAQRKKHQDEYLANMDQRGYKIGVKIKSGQEIVQFSFGGTKGEIMLSVAPGVTQELEGALGSDPGEKWVGLVPPPDGRRKHRFPVPTMVCYPFTLIIKPVTHMPQVVPVVLTYANVSFAQHYLLDVRILSPQKGIKTSINAIF